MVSLPVELVVPILHKCGPFGRSAATALSSIWHEGVYGGAEGREFLVYDWYVCAEQKEHPVIDGISHMIEYCLPGTDGYRERPVKFRERYFAMLDSLVSHEHYQYGAGVDQCQDEWLVGVQRYLDVAKKIRMGSGMSVLWNVCPEEANLEYLGGRVFMINRTKITRTNVDVIVQRAGCASRGFQNLQHALKQVFTPSQLWS